MNCPTGALSSDRLSLQNSKDRVSPWQKISVTEEDQFTVSSECEDIFEAEANFRAAELIFQCERFEVGAREYNLSVQSAIYLGNRSDSFCHSALRRFVERNHWPCLLMVLTETLRECADGGTSYFVVYSIASNPFTNEFGEPINLKFINPWHELGEILNNSGHGEIALSDIKGFSRPCTVQTFSNGFKTFVLIHPKQLHRFRKSAHFRNELADCDTLPFE